MKFRRDQVTDVRQVAVPPADVERKVNPKAEGLNYFEVYADTDLTYQGKPVTAFCAVNSLRKDENGQPRVTEQEFYISDDDNHPMNNRYAYHDGFGFHNLEDVAPNAIHEMRGPDGPVSYQEAVDALTDLGRQAVTECEHVCMFDEYMAARRYIHAVRTNMPEPEPADYDVYLNSMEKRLQERTIPFVGMVKSLSDMPKAYASRPMSDVEKIDDMEQSFEGLDK